MRRHAQRLAFVRLGLRLYTQCSGGGPKILTVYHTPLFVVIWNSLHQLPCTSAIPILSFSGQKEVSGGNTISSSMKQIIYENLKKTCINIPLRATAPEFLPCSVPDGSSVLLLCLVYWVCERVTLPRVQIIFSLKSFGF